MARQLPDVSLMRSLQITSGEPAVNYRLCSSESWKLPAANLATLTAGATFEQCLGNYSWGQLLCFLLAFGPTPQASDSPFSAASRLEDFCSGCAAPSVSKGCAVKYDAVGRASIRLGTSSARVSAARCRLSPGPAAIQRGRLGQSERRSAPVRVRRRCGRQRVTAGRRLEIATDKDGGRYGGAPTGGARPRATGARGRKRSGGGGQRAGADAAGCGRAAAGGGGRSLDDRRRSGVRRRWPPERRISPQTRRRAAANRGGGRWAAGVGQRAGARKAAEDERRRRRPRRVVAGLGCARGGAQGDL